MSIDKARESLRISFQGRLETYQHYFESGSVPYQAAIQYGYPQIWSGLPGAYTGVLYTGVQWSDVAATLFLSSDPVVSAMALLCCFAADRTEQTSWRIKLLWEKSAAHPVRWIRSHAMYYAYRLKFGFPFGVTRMHETNFQRKMHQLPVPPGETPSWRHYDLTMMEETLKRLAGKGEFAPQILAGPSLFPGKTKEWTHDHGYPILSALWSGGDLSFDELRFVDPRSQTLQADVAQLTELGEVTVRAGKYALRNAAKWAGPPW